jgi:NADH-quinone oxidoreductase subunit L
MAAWLISLIIGLSWLGGLFVWIVGDKRPHAQHVLAIGFSLAAALAALTLLPFSTDTAVISIPMGSIFGKLTFVPDGLGVFLAIIATTIGSLSVIFSVDYMRDEAQLGRYYALILYFIGAMAALALTGSLLFLFIFWEVTAFCSYALISFYNDDPKAVAGGIKALIITQLGGIGLLVGSLVTYTYVGDYQISHLLAQAKTLPPAILAAMAFGCLAAAAAKSAQIPFHTWLPDAMEAPTPVSALIHAATMVNAGVYLLARFYPAFALVPGWKTAVISAGLLSALLAALMALVCNDLKRVLAYSTISQLGYMVYAVGVGGIFASQFHLLSHAVFKALLFLGAGAVIHTVGTRDMRQMGGLGQEMPFVRNAFVTGALALAGLPLLNGFWSKEMVLEVGWADGPAWAYLGMLLGAGITALYTFRMVWMVFFGKPRHAQQVHDAPAAMRVSLGVLSLGTITTWLLAGPFVRLLAVTFPYHSLHIVSTQSLIQEVLSAPTTPIALLIIGLGLALWWWRERLMWIRKFLERPSQFATNDFGFETINGWIITATQNTAIALRQAQTGQLNWNVVGIIGSLILVLAILARSM